MNIEEMKKQELELNNAWKTFGMDTQAGRELRKMYGYNTKTNINYPKPKTKEWDYKKEAKNKFKSNKPCPQKTKINYPKMVNPKEKEYEKLREKFGKVDLIPKRKNQNIIEKEYNQIFNEMKNYKNKVLPGKNREKMKLDFQSKLKYGKDEPGTLTNEEEEKIKISLKAKMKLKIGQFDIPDEYKFLKKEEKNQTELEELSELFDQIVIEIEERQKMLNECINLDADELKKKLKQEIVDRVSELQSVTDMIKKAKNKLK